MRYSKVDRRKRNELTSRINTLEAMINHEKVPDIQQYYINVLRELETQLKTL